MDTTTNNASEGARRKSLVVVEPINYPIKIKVRRTTEEELNKNPNRKAFRALLPELLKTHRELYVAICEGKLISSGRVKADVYTEAIKQCDKHPIYLGFVSEQPERIYLDPRKYVLCE